jgi:hypothetical protein
MNPTNLTLPNANNVDYMNTTILAIQPDLARRLFHVPKNLSTCWRRFGPFRARFLQKNTPELCLRERAK